MRLIDADSFKNLETAISLANGYDIGFVNEFCKLIDSCPTAYDADKVVERLEERYMEMINGTRKLSISDFFEYIENLLRL